MSLHIRTKHSTFALLTAVLLAGATHSALAQNSSDATGEANPYLLWTGPEYKWPSETLDRPQLTSKWVVPPANDDDNAPRLNYAIVCGDLQVSTSNMSPFYKDTQAMPQSILPGALILRDSRIMDGTMCFSHVDEMNFVPGPDKDSIMGYAKALAESSNPQNGTTITVLKGPSEIGRKEMMFLKKPLFLTWRTQRPDAKLDLMRTDFFFDLNNGTLLVVSAISSPATHNALIADVKEFARYAIITPKE